MVELPELSIDEETSHFILDRARAFEEKTAPSGLQDASNAVDDDQTALHENQARDPMLEEFAGAVRALNADQQTDLLALVLVGRGDFLIDEWPDARAAAAEMRGPELARYLAGTPLFAAYFKDGLQAAGRDISEYAPER